MHWLCCCFTDAISPYYPVAVLLFNQWCGCAGDLQGKISRRRPFSQSLLGIWSVLVNVWCCVRIPAPGMHSLMINAEQQPQIIHKPPPNAPQSLIAELKLPLNYSQRYYLPAILPAIPPTCYTAILAILLYLLSPLYFCYTCYTTCCTTCYTCDIRFLFGLEAALNGFH